MKKQKNLIIVIVLLVILAGIYMATRGDEASEPTIPASVTLAATLDKETYASGETVALSIELTNTGKAATCVSDNSQGNVAFLSVTRDGEAVATRTAPSDFLEELSMLVTADLTTLAPSETLAIAAPSSFDPGLDAEALYVSNALEDTTFYDISSPGVHEVVLVYEYIGGESDECLSIYKDQTNTATVSFTIE